MEATIDTPMTITAIETEIKRRGCYPGVGPYGQGADIQQNPAEFARFASFCLTHQVKTVLELGTGRTGGLAAFMTEVLGWKVTSIDITRPEPLHPDVEFVQGTTQEVYPYVAHRRFDLVFIDADHELAAVKADWRAFAACGRIVAFHDIAPNRRCCPGTIQFWRELAYEAETAVLKDGYFEAIADSENAGIGWYINPEQTYQLPSWERWAEPLPAQTPDITVVSGTYNRLGYLQGMIESARRGVPRGIMLDFVIVDGGSTDGSIEWLKGQADVTLIEHGELRGAIRAFCDGALEATGKYVVMANDDIVFIGDGLYRAFCHLETNGQVGAVAFAFDTPQNPNRFGVNSQLYIDDETYSTPYAQVGMYPRWLGDAVGWWGADDPLFNARTYGGDNYLTSRIIESGYHIDPLKGAEYHDLLAPDELRWRNNHAVLYEGTHPDSQAWLDRFNGGLPVWRSALLERPVTENLRILYIPIYDGDSEVKQKERIGWLTSLQKIGSVVEVDYRNYSQRYGANALLGHLLLAIQIFKPHLCITQVHTPDLLTAEVLTEMRRAKPDMLVINWNGDEYVPVDLPAGMAYMKLVDLQLIVNGKAFTPLLEAGIKTAYQFDSFQSVDPNPDMPAHDVVFLGNAYRQERWSLEEALRAVEGVNVGLYGRGWASPDGDTLYHYSASYGLYNNAKLAVVDNMYDDRFAYVSDRTFMALAHSQCVLWKPCPGAESIFGFIEGVHYIAWSDLNDLQDKIKYWLDPKRDKQRRKIGDTARAFMHRYHTYDSRTRMLLETIERTLA